jgi:hypothetical protein
MHKSLATHVSLIIAVLIASPWSSSAQASGSETPMGDTWPSQVEFIYIPRAAIAPGAVDDPTMLVEDSSPLQRTITLELKKTSSQHIAHRNSWAARLRSEKLCAPRHAGSHWRCHKPRG